MSFRAKDERAFQTINQSNTPFIGQDMNNDKNNKNNNLMTILAAYPILSVLIVTRITTFSAVLTQAIKQAQSQSLNIREKGISDRC